MNRSPREPTHYAYIDAVRGFAFLAVLAIHTAVCVGNFPKSKLVMAGEYGVQLFFLASAITLYSSMKSRSQRERYPVLFFYLRRLFRIAPLFWLAMVFYWAFPDVMPRGWQGQWAPPEGVHPSYYLLTALFLHGWYPYTFTSIVPGGWSIAVEMNFYLVLPLLFFYIDTLRKAALAVLAGILFEKLQIHLQTPAHQYLFPGTNDNVFYFFIRHWFPAQLPVFLIGIFAYHALQTSWAQALAQSRFWAASLSVLCLLALPGFLEDTGAGLPGGIPIVLALAALIIAISKNSIPLIVNRAVCYVGRLSYSCYLVHFAALGIVLRLFRIRPVYDTGHHLLNLVWFLVLYVSALCLTLPISALTLHLVETPGIKLGKMLIGRLSKPQGQLA